MLELRSVWYTDENNTIFIHYWISNNNLFSPYYKLTVQYQNYKSTTYQCSRIFYVFWIVRFIRFNGAKHTRLKEVWKSKGCKLILKTEPRKKKMLRNSNRDYNYKRVQDDFSRNGLECFWNPVRRQSSVLWSPAYFLVNRSLDNLAWPGLLPVRVPSLVREAQQEAVRALGVQHKLLDILHGLGHGDPLDTGLPPQLLHHHPLLLKVWHSKF